MSTYSLFTPLEREKILAQAELAFQTLVDKEKRKAYDAALLASGRFSPMLPRARILCRKTVFALGDISDLPFLPGIFGFMFVDFTHPFPYFSVCFLNDSNEFMVDFHHLNQL